MTTKGRILEKVLLALINGQKMLSPRVTSAATHRLTRGTSRPPQVLLAKIAALNAFIDGLKRRVQVLEGREHYYIRIPPSRCVWIPEVNLPLLLIPRKSLYQGTSEHTWREAGTQTDAALALISGADNTCAGAGSGAATASSFTGGSAPAGGEAHGGGGGGGTHGAGVAGESRNAASDMFAVSHLKKARKAADKTLERREGSRRKKRKAKGSGYTSIYSKCPKVKKGLPIEKVRKRLCELLDEKIYEDDVHDGGLSKRTSFPSFIYDKTLHRLGIPNLASKATAELLKTVRITAAKDRHKHQQLMLWFGRVAGMIEDEGFAYSDVSSNFCLDYLRRVTGEASVWTLTTAAALAQVRRRPLLCSCCCSFCCSCCCACCCSGCSC